MDATLGLLLNSPAVMIGAMLISRPHHRRRTLVIVRAFHKAGTMTLTARAPGLWEATIRIQSRA